LITRNQVVFTTVLLQQKRYLFLFHLFSLILLHTILEQFEMIVSKALPLLLLSLAKAAEHKLPLSAANVHWGYFSKTLSPALTISSGDEVEVEMATHHGCDDWDLMIEGDPGMEDVFFWDHMTGANEHFRGATGGGDGVHVLTGPIFVEGAEPGDMLKVEILDLKPRKNPKTGKTYGSNAAAWWGFQARVDKVDGTSFKAGQFTGTPVSF